MITGKNKSGLTLIELLVAVAVGALIMTGTLTMISLSRKTQRASRDMSEAALAANAELEKLRAGPSPELKPGLYPITKGLDDHSTGTLRISEFGDTGLYEAAVVIQKNSSKGNRRVIFNTLIPKKEAP